MEVEPSPGLPITDETMDCCVTVVDASTVIDISADWESSQEPLVVPCDSDVKPLLDLTVKALPEAVVQPEALVCDQALEIPTPYVTNCNMCGRYGSVLRQATTCCMPTPASRWRLATLARKRRNSHR